MNSTDETFENDAYSGLIKLKKPIHLSDLREGGATWEAEQQPVEETHGPQMDFDENLLYKLQCGTYGEEIRDDEYNTSESDDDLEPFEKLALNMEDLTFDGGVKKRIVDHGYGGVVPAGSFVVFKYNVYQEYSDEPFDSSMFQNKPTKIHLGRGELISGLEIAVSSMMKKECSHFIVQPKYAYGELGCPPRIPGNATLYYEVTMHDAVDSAAADAFSHYGDEQQTTASFDERYKAANGYRNMGNDHFKHENYSSSKRNYKMGSWILESTKLENAEQEELHQKLLFKMYTNCAMACLKLNDQKGACVQCRCALQLNKYGEDLKVAQLFYRYGEAKRLLHDYQQAFKYAHKAFKLKPGDYMIKNLMNRIDEDAKKAERDDKILYSSMLGIRKKGDIELADQMKRMALVGEEFKETLKSQMTKLADDNLKNSFISLRSNLTDEEIEYARKTAHEAGFSVEVITQGKNKHFRLYRQT